MNPNTLLYLYSAQALKLNPIPRPEIDAVEIKLGKHRYFFRGGYSPFNNCASASITSNKACMHKLLDAGKFPIAKSKTISKAQFKANQLKEIIEPLSFPLVVKPMSHQSGGKDVLCNIKNFADLKTYVADQIKKHDFLQIEEFHGNLIGYRVLVFNQRVIGVVRRDAAQVVGDGIHTIQELIDITNDFRKKQIILVGPIRVDTECLTSLKELNMTVDTIPPANQVIPLGFTNNFGRGGTFTAMDKQIHPKNAQLLCQAAKTLALNLVGFDFNCEDIMIPLEKSRGIIIEANYAPDISIHEVPMFGVPFNVSRTILKQLIYKHPLSYLYGVIKSFQKTIYWRSGIVFSILLACRFFLVKVV